MERPIIMRSPAFSASPPDGEWLPGRGSRLVDTEHGLDGSSDGAVCPAQNATICGLAEYLPPVWLAPQRKPLNPRHLQGCS